MSLKVWRVKKDTAQPSCFNEGKGCCARSAASEVSV